MTDNDLELKGEFKCTQDKVMAWKNAENSKEVKYFENLEDKADSHDFKQLVIATEDMNSSLISVDYLKKAMKVIKATESEVVKIYSGENYPLVIELKDSEGEYNGEIVIAPRIKEEDY